MEEKILSQIYYSRPFRTRNADEFDLENILDLFIDPTDGLIWTTVGSGTRKLG